MRTSLVSNLSWVFMSCIRHSNAMARNSLDLARLVIVSFKVLEGIKRSNQFMYRQLLLPRPNAQSCRFKPGSSSYC